MAATVLSKPLILHGHKIAVNSWKVALILEELRLPYEHRYLEFEEMKKPPFEALNPNGRVPVLEDPNTGIVLFESGAIIQYLIERYDTSLALTYASLSERYQLLSWLSFQISGQGPYYGQKAWFSHYHAEQLPSAVERYGAEINRVIGVLDRHLRAKKEEKAKGKENAGNNEGNDEVYLVGDRCTFADLVWVPYHLLLPTLLMPGWDYKSEFPVFANWHERLLARPSVQKIVAEREKYAK